MQRPYRGEPQSGGRGLMECPFCLILFEGHRFEEHYEECARRARDAMHRSMATANRQTKSEDEYVAHFVIAFGAACIIYVLMMTADWAIRLILGSITGSRW